jgi:sugar lactone lactonase YvrE
MTLGRKGVAGNDRDTFNGPSDVVVSRAGEIFVLDGHGCNDQNAAICTARVVKFSRDGKFVKAWGRTGSKPMEFRGPHSLFLDSRERLIVCDRFNGRLQVFDRDGTLLDTWTSFGRPSGVFITRDDTMYVVDDFGEFDTNGKIDPAYAGLRPGVYIGSAKDGSVRSFIPDEFFGPEDVTADERGDIYVAESYPQAIRKFIVDPARVRRLASELRQ